MSVSSRSTSSTPRVASQRVIEKPATPPPRRYAEVPARKKNAGAQKWVTQRVRNTPAVGPPAGTPENTRTWSSAMSTITAPRTMSTDVMRDVMRDAMRSRTGAGAAANSGERSIISSEPRPGVAERPYAPAPMDDPGSFMSPARPRIVQNARRTRYDDGPAAEAPL